MSLRIIPAFALPQEVAVLFSEYTHMLIEEDNSFEKYLEMQDYDDELKHLGNKYGLPYGRLYLAYEDKNLAGCIALKKVDEQACEMKRLYVRPNYRGKHIGSSLIDRIISDAREVGYAYMLLDTVPFLQSAIQLYKKHGFYEVERYNNNPMDTSVYMKLDL